MLDDNEKNREYQLGINPTLLGDINLIKKLLSAINFVTGNFLLSTNQGIICSQSTIKLLKDNDHTWRSLGMGTVTFMFAARNNPNNVT